MHRHIFRSARWPIAIAVLVIGLASLAGRASAVGQGTPSLKGQSVTFVSWGGSLQSAEEAAFTKPFAKSTGAKVSTDSPVDYAKIKAQVQSHQVLWDVVHGDSFFVYAECGKLFAPLSKAAVPALKTIDPKLITNRCGVPHMRYGILLAYNAAKYGNNPPKTWADFFNTKKFPGKRGAWGYSQNGMIEAALLADGVSSKNLYPMNLNRAFGKLDTIKSDMVWAQSPGQVSEQMLSGSIDMAVVYSGRAYDAVKNGAKTWKVAWNAPTIQAWEEIAVVKGTKHLRAATALANYFGQAAPQSRFAKLIAYTPTNLKAHPKLPKLLASFSITTHKNAKVVQLSQSWWAKNFDRANTQWTSWQTG